MIRPGEGTDMTFHRKARQSKVERPRAAEAWG